MKVIAFYLPQFHNIPENDIWWGKGYTEWTSLKRGEKLIENQYQPRIPLNHNYYDLTDIDVMKWQVELAKKYGIYGFCFYHYWFNGHLLLETPLEQFLSHTEIDFPFYLCWANERWTTIWEGESNPKVLIEHNYEVEKDIDRHFMYYLKYFKDFRYMKINNKPILCILNPLSIRVKTLKNTLKRWEQMAIDSGFNGIVFTYQSAEAMCFMSDDYRNCFDYGIEYEPAYVQCLDSDILYERKRFAKSRLKHWLANRFPFLKAIYKIQNFNQEYEEEIAGVKEIRDYDHEWEKLLAITHDDYAKYIPGGFVDWDNTPRRGRKGKVILGASPEKFEQYFEKLVIKTRDVYKKDMVALFAWNEWSEGGYLEPDERWGYGYLEAIYNVLQKLDELPAG